MINKKKSDSQIKQDRTEQIMNIIAERCAYYRANPSRFIEDWIPGLHLRMFQKIILWAMAHNDMFYIIASRGIGKTYLMALYGVYKCILYPGTKYVCCSYTFKQGKEILLKITDDFMQKSSLLRNEISKVSVGQNDCAIYYKNGSWQRVVVAAESSRGVRSTVLATDESRMVNQKIVDTVLRPMNSSPRQPGYLSKPEYAHLKDCEVPQEFYLSSAYFKQSEMYSKIKAYTANSLDPNLKFFVCDLPYQLSIREGILLRQTIENEMSEATFSEVSFMMEREGLFYGSAEDALFDFNTVNKCRILKESLHSLEYYRISNLRIPEKQKGELRVLSVDIALLASKRHQNDASALIIHSLIPTPSNNYLDNIVFIDTQEGLMTEELGLLIMRYYNQYDCDYIAIDANGVGQSVLDYLMGGDRFDPEYSQTYSCLNVIDNEELSERCKVHNAPKVIYAIKANSRSNNDMCLSLRSGFQNGYINLLCDENNIEDYIVKIRGYSKLPEGIQNQLRLPYIQTSLLINELINLTHDVSNGLIKVKERSGMRKDRYSSLEYGWYVAQELSKQLKPDTNNDDLLDLLITRPAQRSGRY